MGTIASQITSLTSVYSTVYSGADQSKHQSSASLAFVWGIHRDRWIPRTNGQLRGKCFHLMTSSYIPEYFRIAVLPLGQPYDWLLWNSTLIKLTSGHLHLWKGPHTEKKTRKYSAFLIYCHQFSNNILIINAHICTMWNHCGWFLLLCMSTLEVLRYFARFRQPFWIT